MTKEKSTLIALPVIAGVLLIGQLVALSFREGGKIIQSSTLRLFQQHHSRLLPFRAI